MVVRGAERIVVIVLLVLAVAALLLLVGAGIGGVAEFSESVHGAAGGFSY